MDGCQGVEDIRPVYQFNRSCGIRHSAFGSTKYSVLRAEYEVLASDAVHIGDCRPAEFSRSGAAWPQGRTDPKLTGRVRQDAFRLGQLDIHDDRPDWGEAVASSLRHPTVVDYDASRLIGMASNDDRTGRCRLVSSLAARGTWLAS